MKVIIDIFEKLHITIQFVKEVYIPSKIMDEIETEFRSKSIQYISSSQDLMGPRSAMFGGIRVNEHTQETIIVVYNY